MAEKIKHIKEKQLSYYKTNEFSSCLPLGILLLIVIIYDVEMQVDIIHNLNAELLYN